MPDQLTTILSGVYHDNIVQNRTVRQGPFEFQVVTSWSGSMNTTGSGDLTIGHNLASVDLAEIVYSNHVSVSRSVSVLDGTDEYSFSTVSLSPATMIRGFMHAIPDGSYTHSGFLLSTTTA